MKPYSLYLGNCHDVLDTLEENSVDSIVTDPPYEINFMAKSWDNAGVAFNPKTWQKALRVLKPGGHMLVFGHSRKMHRIIVAIEDAGFEIRDTLMWLYGSGFPKSHNVAKFIEGKLVNGNSNTQGFNKLNGDIKNVKQGYIKMQVANGSRPREMQSGKSIVNVQYTTSQAKQYDGWGTALKPAYEPIVLARKPFKGSIAENVLKHGVGGINIDECRVGSEHIKEQVSGKTSRAYQSEETTTAGGISAGNIGRFPANVMHDGSDEVTSGFLDSGGSSQPRTNKVDNNVYGDYNKITTHNEIWGDSGNASRFFYCAKASKKDREEGLDNFDLKRESDRVKEDGVGGDNPRNRSNHYKRNTHPTVKPTELMQYLVRLITPKGGTVLDPFMGSGSTGKATMIENNERNSDYKFIGIDLTEEYIEIARVRIEYGLNYFQNKEKETPNVSQGQINLFDF